MQNVDKESQKFTPKPHWPLKSFTLKLKIDVLRGPVTFRQPNYGAPGKTSFRKDTRMRPINPASPHHSQAKWRMENVTCYISLTIIGTPPTSSTVSSIITSNPKRDKNYLRNRCFQTMTENIINFKMKIYKKDTFLIFSSLWCLLQFSQRLYLLGLQACTLVGNVTALKI